MQPIFRIVNRANNEIVATDVCVFDLNRHTIDKSKHILEQFIGLFDDNGKKIYPSDIIEAIDGKMKHISTIHFSLTGVYIENHPTWKEITGKEFALLEDYSDYGCGRGITQRCYVIGNTHEVPEFLNS
jgi:uncharacterized phage protein (TIGR01671 family)